jgi:hypothetical protein
MSTQKTAAPATLPSADDLIDQLHRSGWQDGPPANYPPWARHVDVCTVRKMKCSACGKRGLVPYFMHRDDRLRIVAQCANPRCTVAGGSGEEV